MPYITQDKRYTLEYKTLRQLMNEITELEIGDLNFVISSLIWARFKAAPSYSTGNALVGVLECAKQEFIRRHLNEYENSKITENGDLCT
jgi:hypothetical protein